MIFLIFYFLIAVKCLGTESRVEDESKIVPANDSVLPLVSFPGTEIKDLFVHENQAEPSTSQASSAPPAPQAPPAPPAAQVSNGSKEVRPPAPPAQGQGRGSQPGRGTGRGSGRQYNNQPQQNQQNRQFNEHKLNVSAAQSSKAPGSGSGDRQPRSAVGTGEYASKLRVKKTGEEGAAAGTADVKSEFDIMKALSSFNKSTELAAIAAENPAPKIPSYKKDDFFDTLSCDILDREQGKQTRLTPNEERTLNQDTFGAIALQSSNNYRRFGGRGGRGESRGGGRGYQVKYVEAGNNATICNLIICLNFALFSFLLSYRDEVEAVVVEDAGLAADEEVVVPLLLCHK